MSEPLDEQAARDLLAQAGSPAADPEHYTGTRADTGWVFGWSGPERAPMGVGPWVVGDSGQVRRVRISTRVADVLNELAEES
jgi:hypothetical protein